MSAVRACPPHERVHEVGLRRALSIGSGALALVVGTALWGGSGVFAATRSATPKSASAPKTTKATAKTTKKTTKAGAKVAVSAKAPAVASAPTVTAEPPVSLSSPGDSLKGFGRVADSEWPAVGDAVIAVPTARAIQVWRAPDKMSSSMRLVAGKAAYGDIRMLAVGGSNGWVKVLLTVRPNGSTGWVRASDVTLQRSFLRVVIELATNTLRVYDGDAVTIQAKVATGTGGTPTPQGLFFVKEKVPQANPKGALGPIALGTSGYSEVLDTFAGGFGTVAMHGTNAPAKLGAAVSHGCVRVDNATIESLAELLPLGTPVEIVDRIANLPTARVASTWVESVNAAPTGATGAAVVAAGAAGSPTASVIAAPVDAATTTAATTTDTTTTTAEAAPTTTVP